MILFLLGLNGNSILPPRDKILIYATRQKTKAQNAINPLSFLIASDRKHFQKGDNPNEYVQRQPSALSRKLYYVIFENHPT